MIKRPAVLITGVLIFYPALAILFLMFMPQPLGPLAYLVAGAFAAAICLVVGFVMHARSASARTVRKNERSS